MALEFKSLYQKVKFNPVQPIPDILASVGDTTGGLLVSVVDNGGSTLTIGNEVMYLKVKKPDQTEVFIRSEIEDNAFKITFTDQMLAVPGVLFAELRLIGSNYENLGSRNFIIRNETAVVSDEAIESSNEFSALTEVLSEAQSYKDQIEELEGKFAANDETLAEIVQNSGAAIAALDAAVALEQARQEAEVIRIENETARNTNEGNRITAEQTRSTNEQTRNQNEIARVNNEDDRIEAEQARATAELERINKENARITNEGDATSGRVKAEIDRVAAEQGRSSAEQTRVTQEVARVAAESGRAAQIANKADKLFATNLVTNGDFSNGTTGWSASGGIISVVGGKLEFIANGGDTGVRFETSTSISTISGNKYYVRFLVNSPKATTVNINIGGQFAIGYPLVSNIDTPISSIITSNGSLAPFRFYLDTVVSKLISGDKVYSDLVNIVNLTQIFGAGKEPTKEQMDWLLAQKYMNSWFDGTKELTSITDLLTLVNTKADKTQEAWITATLVNNFTGTVRYAKNSLGIVLIEFEIIVGSTTTAYTTMTTLPIGYRPKYDTPIYTFNDNTFGVLGIRLSSVGTLSPLASLTTGHKLKGSVMYYGN